MKNRIEKIGILCFWPFPEGMAPTTRILAYSKGLVKNGVDVEIVSFRRIYKDDVKKENIKRKGIVNGIKYTYPHFFLTVGRNCKLIRGFDEIILRIKILFYFSSSTFKKPFDTILLSFDDPHSLKTYTRLLAPFKIPLGLVADEYPIPIRDLNQSEVPKSYIKKYKKFHRPLSFRILMSKALERFYNEKISQKPTFLLNTVIDAERFENIRTERAEKKFICYMGNMDLNKDNVDNIIHAFSLVADQIPDIELYLYGTPKENDAFLLKNLISKKNLSERAFLKGRIGYNDVPKVLVNAYILVSSQPVSMRAEGGFPTKLGEYLLSGTPSIFTDAGEINEYIIDGVNGFIVERNNPKAFSEKILFIANNYSQSLEVARKGKAFIQNAFETQKVTGELLRFLNQQLK